MREMKYIMTPDEFKASDVWGLQEFIKHMETQREGATIPFPFPLATDIEVTTNSDLPKGELFYFDIKYEDNEESNDI